MLPLLEVATLQSLRVDSVGQAQVLMVSSQMRPGGQGFSVITPSWQLTNLSHTSGSGCRKNPLARGHPFEGFGSSISRNKTLTPIVYLQFRTQYQCVLAVKIPLAFNLTSASSRALCCAHQPPFYLSLVVLSCFLNNPPNSEQILRLVLCLYD